jgi:hypothetical protein
LDSLISKSTEEARQANDTDSVDVARKRLGINAMIRKATPIERKRGEW